jgi:hypothetical protein
MIRLHHPTGGYELEMHPHLVESQHVWPAGKVKRYEVCAVGRWQVALQVARLREPD